MSRAYNALGVTLAGVCGGLIMYTTLQPELENQKADRTGEFRENHPPPGDKVISQAITSDLQEAKRQVTHAETGGFAWGIRQAIFGKPETDQPNAAVGNSTGKECEVTSNNG